MSGVLYLAVVLDVDSRKSVGWSMKNHLRTALILNALDMAVGQRKPKDVIHHSDQGGQDTSLAFGSRCKQAGVKPSMGSVREAYDNTMAESVVSTLDCEPLGRRSFSSQTEACMACFTYVGSFTTRCACTRASATVPPSTTKGATTARKPALGRPNPNKSTDRP